MFGSLIAGGGGREREKQSYLNNGLAQATQ